MGGSGAFFKLKPSVPSKSSFCKAQESPGHKGKADELSQSHK